ncbi:MAG: hypothetical protein GXP10_06245, partial [Gammaproteobacteria bacterium]|nr:hypothetical protein [Gammaproteobacteria bacterium]
AIKLALQLNNKVFVPKVAIQLAMNVFGEEGSIAFMARLCEDYSGNKSLISNQVSLLDSYGKTDELFELYRKHKAFFNNKSLSIIMRHDFPAELSDDKDAYIRNVNDKSSKRHINIAIRCSAERGDTDRLKQILRFSCRGNNDISHWSSRLPENSELKRSVFSVDGNAKELTPAVSKNSSGIVLVFTGMHGNVWMPCSFLDYYFAALNLSAFYLRDYQRLLFLNGIASLGKDFLSTVNRLREIIEGTGIQRLFTFSASAGGFAAIRYGLELGAETALCFSPPFNLTQDFLEHDPRGKIVQRRLLSKVDNNVLDARSLIESASNSMAVHTYYGDGVVTDRRHSEYLLGVQSVTLHPLEGCKNHDSLSFTANRYNLLSLLGQHYNLSAA